jgi:glycosyltransferase involved in cell wall biosynthesis
MPPPKILLISYLFPPAGGIAVQRALSLAKYLPRCGFEVHVLKGRNSSGPVEDPSLLRHVPDAVTVHSAFAPELPFVFRQKLWKRVAANNGGARSAKSSFAWKPAIARLAKRILCPEPEILWVPFATRAAAGIIRRHGIRLVLITAPPFSAFVAGNRLKRRFPDLKLVSDFRDEWLSFYLKDFDFQSGEHTRRRAGEIERETIERSGLVVAVTESSKEEIRRRYPDQPGAKFVCLPNGYDPEVFADFRPRSHGGPRVVVTHMGTVYKTASPRYYLNALDGMPEALRNRIETRFIGRVSEGERELLEGRKSAVRQLGFLPQAEALHMAEDTDFLLLTMTNDISLPGKLYEYLAMRKPVLAITRRGGEVERILRETSAGWVADPDDCAGIQAMLSRAIDSVGRGHDAVVPDGEAIRRYERPRLAAEYADLMRRVLEEEPLPLQMPENAAAQCR